MDSEVRTVLVTAPDPETAERIGRTLVDERLAACVNVVGGVTSIYRWEGEVERAEEALMVIKTRQDRAERLAERVVELHPYDVPEVLVLRVAGGHGPYLGWVQSESRPPGSAEG